jgi:hypothetical protein
VKLLSSAPFCLALLGALWGASLSFAQDWRVILDGKNPEPAGWKHVGAGALVLEDGAWKTIGSPDGLGLFTYTREKLGDCQIRVVFKTDEPADNGGVYIRIADDPEGKLTTPLTKDAEADSEAEIGPWWAVHNGYEVQIHEGGDPAHRTGSIYSLAESGPLPPRPADGWRTLLITLDGPKVTVSVDGEPISQYDSTAPAPDRKQWYEPKRGPKRPEAGFIGLQNHDPGDDVYYKEVAVRPLPGK